MVAEKKRKRQVLEVALRNCQFRHLNLVQNVLFRELRIVISVRARGNFSKHSRLPKNVSKNNQDIILVVFTIDDLLEV